MANVKLTDKPVGSAPSSNTYVVVTQPETVNGVTTESVRKLPLSALDGMIAPYSAMAVDSFTAGTIQAEIGSTVNSVTLNYSLNKVPTSLKLDGNTITAQMSGSIALAGQGITSNKTWTLQATDERGSVASKSASLTFLNRCYYGVGETPAAINSAFLLGLANTPLASSKSRTFTVSPGENQYIWYAVPSRFGACSFNAGGFDGGFILAATITHLNASGYSEQYLVYRSSNANLGSTKIIVS